MNNNSLFLASRPSLLEGIGRVFDFAGAMNVYNHSDTPDQADMIAMQADWTAVADDLKEAFARFERDEIKQHP